MPFFVNGDYHTYRETQSSFTISFCLEVNSSLFKDAVVAITPSNEVKGSDLLKAYFTEYFFNRILLLNSRSEILGPENKFCEVSF